MSPPALAMATWFSKLSASLSTARAAYWRGSACVLMSVTSGLSAPTSTSGRCRSRLVAKKASVNAAYSWH